MQRWEYMFVVSDFTKRGDLKVRWVNGSELPGWESGGYPVEQCNRLGREGWEMVSYVVIPSSSQGTEYGSASVNHFTQGGMVFKRPL